MFIRDYMSRAPITISKETPVLKVLSIMKKNRDQTAAGCFGKEINRAGNRKDLLNVSPSPATSLSIFE